MGFFHISLFLIIFFFLMSFVMVFIHFHLIVPQLIYSTDFLYTCFKKRSGAYHGNTGHWAAKAKIHILHGTHVHHCTQSVGIKLYLIISEFYNTICFIKVI